jgi:hypothetical protein
MTEENNNNNNNNNNNEDDSPVISDSSGSTSDMDVLRVFKVLESVGFRFIDYHETDIGHHSAVEKS